MSDGRTRAAVDRLFYQFGTKYGVRSLKSITQPKARPARQTVKAK
jgi:hypothetical protein